MGTAYDIELEGGAKAGDHLYHCHIMDHKKMGMWGLFRVHTDEQADLKPLDKSLGKVSGKQTNTKRAAKTGNIAVTEGE